MEGRREAEGGGEREGGPPVYRGDGFEADAVRIDFDDVARNPLESGV